MAPPEDHNPPPEVGGEMDPLLDTENGALPAWQPLRLSARHLVMIELHLQGFKNTDIADLMKCHEVTVGMVLRSQPAQDMLKERVEHINIDFQAQFRQVVDTFAAALDPAAAIDIRLAAADKWLKAHGHYQPKEKKKESGKLTIEDVIGEIQKGNVTINVDNRKQTYYSGGGPWAPERTVPSAKSAADSHQEQDQSAEQQDQPRSITSGRD